MPYTWAFALCALKYQWRSSASKSGGGGHTNFFPENQKKKNTWAPQKVHNTPVMNILKGYF